jgi:hypothetical protein
MSIVHNTYVIVGVKVPFGEFRQTVEERDIDWEKYLDEADGPVAHHHGLCVLSDGFDCKYVIIGRVLAKSPKDLGLQAPCSVDPHELFLKDHSVAQVVLAAIADQFGIERAWDAFEVITVTHYR